MTGKGARLNGFSNLGTKHETIPFERYDSFATRRFGGNVAGVVLTEVPLAPAVMQHIAAELGAPTTGFVDRHAPAWRPGQRPARRVQLPGQ